jgi:hypothetical protein
VSQSVTVYFDGRWGHCFVLEVYRLQDSCLPGQAASYAVVKEAVELERTETDSSSHMHVDFCIALLRVEFQDLDVSCHIINVNVGDITDPIVHENLNEARLLDASHEHNEFAGRTSWLEGILEFAPEMCDDGVAVVGVL